MSTAKVMSVYVRPRLNEGFYHLCQRLQWTPKWRCGHCGKGKVNPKLNSRCKGCKAVVAEVIKA